MKTGKMLGTIILITLLSLFSAELSSETHHCLSFRLYEGFRSEMYSPKTVTVLYYLQEQAFNSTLTATEQKKEARALEKLYKLRHIHPLITTGIIIPEERSWGYQLGVMCEENLIIVIQMIEGETELYRVLIMGMDNPYDPVHEFPVRVSKILPGYFPFRFRLKKWYIGVLRPIPNPFKKESFDQSFFYHLPIGKRIMLPEFSNRKTQYVSSDVLLEAVISPRGKIRRIRTLEGHPSLNRRAIQTTRRWRFLPTHFKRNINIGILYKFSLFYR